MFDKDNINLITPENYFMKLCFSFINEKKKIRYDFQNLFNSFK